MIFATFLLGVTLSGSVMADEVNFSVNAPLRGPDFIFSNIREWKPSGKSEGVLSLTEGSVWNVANSSDVIAIKFIMDAGSPVFVAGSIRDGHVEAILWPRKCWVESISDVVENGEVEVTLAPSPRFFVLRVDRPWFASALKIMKQTMLERNKENNSFDKAAILWVTYDQNGEIMDVRRRAIED